MDDCRISTTPAGLNEYMTWIHLKDFFPHSLLFGKIKFNKDKCKR